MSRLRRVALVLAAVAVATAVTLLAVEVVVRVVTGVDLAQARGEREQVRRGIPGDDSRVVEDPDVPGKTARTIDLWYGARYELHPFFGYTFLRGLDGANNHGFMTGGIDFPYERAPAEFVVGIFGGSVAMQVSHPEPLNVLREAVLERVRPLGYRRVRFLSFGVGGWRQPQTFHALTHFLSDIDMALVLDGFNEISQLGDGHLTDYPAGFPSSEVFGGLASRSDSPYAHSVFARLALANDVMLWLTRVVEENPIASRSVAAHMVWRAAAARFGAYVAGVEKERWEVTDADWRLIDPLDADGGVVGKRDRYLASWEELIRHADAMLRSRNKPLFQFIQPNQYDEVSKPLSEEEREKFFGKREQWGPWVSDRYREVDAAMERLRADGIEAYSLSKIFVDVPETMYRDDCCHLNDAGLKKMAGAMANEIRKSAHFDRVPRAGGA